MHFLVRLVIHSVIPAILFEPSGKFFAKNIESFVLRIPIDVKRLDLGAQEVIGTGGSQLGETLCRVTVDEFQDRLGAFNRPNETILLTDLPTQPGNEFAHQFLLLFAGKVFVFGSFKRLITLIALLDVAASALDQRKSQLVTFLVIVSPIDEPVLPHVDSFGVGMPFANILEKQAQIKARALPQCINHFVAKNLLRDFLRAPGSTNRNKVIRVHVIDMLCRNEGMQGRIDGRSTWI